LTVVSALDAPCAASPNLPLKAAALKVLLAPAVSEKPRTIGVPVQGTQLVRGRSTMVIAAPIDKVREAALDFGHYADFMPHYRKCRVLSGARGGAQEVYMEVTAIHGAVTMWARIEVAKGTVVDGVEVYDTKFLDGNVKDLKATFRFRKIDDSSTELSLELFLLPQLPLPDSVLNEENLKGSADAVVAIKQRVTGR